MWSIVRSIASVAGCARGRRHIAGEERPPVPRAVDEPVQRVAVGGDLGNPGLARAVADRVRGGHSARATGCRLVVGAVDVGHRQRDHLDAVAVASVIAGDRRVGAQRPREDEPDPALLQDVRDTVARAGLKSQVGDLGESVGPRRKYAEWAAFPTHSST